MNITTKFTPGDTAFIMLENKVAEVTIDRVTIVLMRSGLYGTVNVRYVYAYNRPDGENTTSDENSLFTTKEELLASL